MGGFMQYRGNTAVDTIQPGYLSSYLGHNQICIIENEIEDRSKGDALSKGFAILQTS
jgi:hypothetical protein